MIPLLDFIHYKYSFLSYYPRCTVRKGPQSPRIYNKFWDYTTIYMVNANGHSYSFENRSNSGKLNTCPVVISKKVHLFKMNNTQIFIYLWFYKVQRKLILFRIIDISFQEATFFKKQSSFFKHGSFCSCK